MNLILLFLLSGSTLILAYIIYGRIIARKLNIDDKNITPAHALKDGIDYEPSKTVVVLGHHFSSIAGAGPIVGPIIAVAFGWIPAVLWILIGGIFFGAVHDLCSMIASMRHDGKSIGTIIKRYIGKDGKRLFLIFSFATLILIIGVFADIIAKTFASNGGVASSSALFIILAIAFGVVNRFYNQKKSVFIITSVIGVVLVYYFVYLGVQLPISLDYTMWIGLLLAYAFIASVTPVTVLLQPRDYLSSFLLYGLMIFGFVGACISNPEIKMEAQVHFHEENLGYLFPVLFVTVACGAISGFHSLVASGTTSKQIDVEKNAKVVGFGGMLIESFLAIMAVGSVIIISREEYNSTLMANGPVTIFANGIGAMISAVGISPELGVTFVALSVSAFALTTLDTCARLARFTLQEYFEDSDKKIGKVVASNRYVATLVVIILAAGLLLSGESSILWLIFGSANQLLAALTLLTVSVWLLKENVNPVFVLIPTFFMFAVTLTSLFLFAVSAFKNQHYILLVISTSLFLLSIILISLARKSLLRLHPSLKQ